MLAGGLSEALTPRSCSSLGALSPMAAVDGLRQGHEAVELLELRCCRRRLDGGSCVMAASGGQPRGVDGGEAFSDGIGEEGKGKRLSTVPIHPQSS